MRFTYLRKFFVNWPRSGVHLKIEYGLFRLQDVLDVFKRQPSCRPAIIEGSCYPWSILLKVNRHPGQQPCNVGWRCCLAKLTFACTAEWWPRPYTSSPCTHTCLQWPPLFWFLCSSAVFFACLLWADWNLLGHPLFIEHSITELPADGT